MEDPKEKVRFRTFRCAGCGWYEHVHPTDLESWLRDRNPSGRCEIVCRVKGCPGLLWEVREGQQTTLHLNLYSVRQNYGGPEEGGWWYESGVALGSVPLPATWEWTGDIYEDDHLHLEPRVKSAHHEAARLLLNLTAMHDTHNYHISLEDHMASDYPRSRPRYE
jgi:hypothetical protein